MLVMRLVRGPEGAELDASAHLVGPTGSTIGRAAECDVVLDDPLRLVSRRHARIEPASPTQATLECVSSSASLTVNGETVAPGGQCMVVAGDRIGIGAFELLLESQAPAPEAAPMPAAPPPVPAAARTAAGPSPAVPATARPSRLDRYFELDTVADPLGPESPLAVLDGPVAAHPGSVAAGAAGTAARKASAALAEGSSGPRGSAHDGVAEAQPANAAVRDRQQPHAGVPGPATAPASTGDVGAATLRQAFLAGAGLVDDSLLGPDPHWASHAGMLLRDMTEGTFDLLRSRATTKQGIRAEGTRIAARQNNPLKFAPDATECLRLLLQQQSRPGFLPPLEALRDAHQDLQLHQLAMLAGMRAAVADLVLRLGPAAIEQAAGPPPFWARLFPWLREAMLWRRQHEQHAKLVNNLDDAFDAAFGREFRLAYEAQARRVGNRPDAAADGDWPPAP